jgi:hypothetical protein
VECFMVLRATVDILFAQLRLCLPALRGICMFALGACCGEDRKSRERGMNMSCTTAAHGEGQQSSLRLRLELGGGTAGPGGRCSIVTGSMPHLSWGMLLLWASLGGVSEAAFRRASGVGTIRYFCRPIVCSWGKLDRRS